MKDMHSWPCVRYLQSYSLPLSIGLIYLMRRSCNWTIYTLERSALTWIRAHTPLETLSGFTMRESGLSSVWYWWIDTKSWLLWNRDICICTYVCLYGRGQTDVSSARRMFHITSNNISEICLKTTYNKFMFLWNFYYKFTLFNKVGSSIIYISIYIRMYIWLSFKSGCNTKTH